MIDQKIILALARQKWEMATESVAQWQLLAVLRFVLAGIVMISHLNGWFGSQPLSAIALLGGRAAVLGFFLISGYSIASSLMRKRQGFYQRRILRIYPLYACAIVFTQILSWQLHPQAVLPHQVFITSGNPTGLCNLLLLQTFACVPLGLNGVVWSLGLECCYYLFAPWLLERSNFQILCLIFASASTYTLLWHTSWVTTLLFGVLAVKYFWVWLLGFLYCRERTIWSIALLLAGYGLVWFDVDDGGGLTFIPYFLTVLCLVNPPKLKFPRQLAATAIYLGDLSYPLYLFHAPIFILLFKFFHTSNTIELALWAIILSAVLLQAVDVSFKHQIAPLFRPKE
jgi:peptidoglycan/LPS O-acetylase OafA/YrhL